MIIARNLPVFLWEYAILHAIYLRNRVYHKSIDVTPYQIWNNRRPNIQHLREFGAPVWVLLQGKDKLPKLQPRSKQRYYVGCEDGSKSILYYNPETRRVLISRNFRFLNLPNHEVPPEQLVIEPEPAVSHEGELGSSTGNMRKTGTENINNNNKHTRDEVLPDGGGEPPRKLRANPRIDYGYLDNPFPDEENEEINKTILNMAELDYSTLAESPEGDRDPITLKEAKESPNWKEWNKAIHVELDVLKNMGTWRLVDCPKEAVPISNKWVFVTKYNKEGELIKRKARLVAKGYAQRPGYDYTDTYSPVVRLETI